MVRARWGCSASTRARWASGPTASWACRSTPSPSTPPAPGLAAVVPERWDEEVMATRRAACHLPQDIHHRPKWQLVLDMLDELGGWDLWPPVLLADSGYGEVGEFRGGLDAPQIGYVVEVRADTSAYSQQVRPSVAPHNGRGRRPRPRDHDQPSSLKELVMAAGQQACVDLIWRRGSRGLQRGRFLALRVRPAGLTPRRLARQHGGELPVRSPAGPVAPWQGHPDQVLAGQPARGHPAGGAGRSGQVALASGAGLPRTQGGPWAGPLRRPRLAWLAPPRHAGLGRARLFDPAAAATPKTGGVGLTLWQLLGELNCPGFDGGLNRWVFTRPPWTVGAHGSSGLRVLQVGCGRARRAGDAGSTTAPTPGWPARPGWLLATARGGRSARPCTAR